ncbi:sensor domain-containing diguanylate cyclase [Aeromicrobium fastidiosum]|uniref:GGDEF domain-containing protein n=1 Tax=Aeromicrobium fastidiosum TaxID=52699 RepID=UPI0020237FE6|nr:sensor domain-containing diguanylate cyclase [Aeromicrobium fastidiosum]MCL8252851.1 sensor domain-containing diguanylate cyclase [Aeromicrobium fastidiosum]
MSTREQVDGADTFSTSADQVIAYLKAHTPIPEWSVSRVAGGEQVHVHTGDNELMRVGRRVPWDDTFCIRMSSGADRIVLDTTEHPSYSDLPDAGFVRAYAGTPITDDDGRTFGTLCGIGTEPLSGFDEIDADLIELMAGLLSSQLKLARIADRARRTADLARALAQTDALTGLTNRRGWDLLIEDADRRITAYGDPVAIAVIDLDGLKALNDLEGHAAGDELIRHAGEVLSTAARAGDRVARYGGDEFAILSNNVAVKDLIAHFARFSEALADAGIAASLGCAPTSAGVVDVAGAFELADADMYAAKQTRRARLAGEVG